MALDTFMPSRVAAGVFPEVIALGDSFTVTMTVESTTALNNVVPTVLHINGGSATVSGPVPASLNLAANTPATFTWIVTPDRIGEYSFSAGATSDSMTFETATSNSGLVSPDGQDQYVEWQLGENVPGTVGISTQEKYLYGLRGAGTATFASPTLVSPDNHISGPGDPVIYEWIATVTPGTDIGSILFTVNSSLGEQADANSVIVTPVLTYAVTVDADPPTVIENTAIINESGLAINNEPSNTTRTTAVPTLAVITAVRSRIEDGVAVISWEVALELDTVGYYLDRWGDGAWVRVSETLIWADPFAPAPKTYEQADPGAPLGTKQRYWIVELDGAGRLSAYGPYEMELDGGKISYETWTTGIAWNGTDSSPDADPDGDSLTNWQEYLAGTDPLNANSVLLMSRVQPTAQGFVLTWPSVAGRVYTLSAATSVKGPYLAIQTGIQATPPENTLVVPVNPAATPSAFFRVVVR